MVFETPASGGVHHECPSLGVCVVTSHLIGLRVYRPWSFSATPRFLIDRCLVRGV